MLSSFLRLLSSLKSCSTCVVWKKREYACKNSSPWTRPFYTWSSKDWCNVVFNVVLAVVLRDICSLIHCPNIGSLGLLLPILASPPSWPCKMVMLGVEARLQWRQPAPSTSSSPPASVCPRLGWSLDSGPRQALPRSSEPSTGPHPCPP